MCDVKEPQLMPHETPRAPISAYIRTKNETRMITETIAAAAAVCDEVVVIDSGSTDDTREKALAAGARVIDHEWLGFGKQKRVAEEACRHEWLLDLDADEIVSPALAAEIAALFADGAPEAAVYRTPMVIAPPVGKPWRGFGGQVRHKLYNRKFLRQPDHAFWDQFDIGADIKKGRLEHPIVHYAWQDAGHLTGKLNSATTASAAVVRQKSKPVLILRIIFGFPFYFSKRYFLDGLFRGGVYGYAFCVMAAYGRWLRDIKMYERVKHAERR